MVWYIYPCLLPFQSKSERRRNTNTREFSSSSFSILCSFESVSLFHCEWSLSDLKCKCVKKVMGSSLESASPKKKLRVGCLPITSLIPHKSGSFTEHDQTNLSVRFLCWALKWSVSVWRPTYLQQEYHPFGTEYFNFIILAKQTNILVRLLY